jgi:hypothetical protein
MKESFQPRPLITRFSIVLTSLGNGGKDVGVERP